MIAIGAGARPCRPVWARQYWLTDYTIYALPPPPFGAVWVRVGGDALLIDQTAA